MRGSYQPSGRVRVVPLPTAMRPSAPVPATASGFRELALDWVITGLWWQPRLRRDEPLTARRRADGTSS